MNIDYLLQIIKLEPSVHEDEMHILTIWTTKDVSNQTHIEGWERNWFNPLIDK